MIADRLKFDRILWKAMEILRGKISDRRADLAHGKTPEISPFCQLTPEKKEVRFGVTWLIARLLNLGKLTAHGLSIECWAKERALEETTSPMSLIWVWGALPPMHSILILAWLGVCSRTDISGSSITSGLLLRPNVGQNRKENDPVIDQSLDDYASMKILYLDDRKINHWYFPKISRPIRIYLQTGQGKFGRNTKYSWKDVNEREAMRVSL
jgi:hypothetical protein